MLRETGEVVAVKVQRPGVQSLVSKDLYVLRRAAEVGLGLGLGLVALTLILTLTRTRTRTLTLTRTLA